MPPKFTQDLHKADNKSDFTKKKRKVGKVAPVAENVTNTSFSTKGLVIPTQNLHAERTGEATNSKNLAIYDLLEKLSHPNAQQRKQVYEGLNDLFTRHPMVLVNNLSILIPRFGESMSDIEGIVRNALCVLLYKHIPLIQPMQFFPFFQIMLQYTLTAVNNINDQIRYDSVHFLRLLIVLYPEDVAQHSVKILTSLPSLLKDKNILLNDARLHTKHHHYTFPMKYILNPLEYWRSTYSAVVNQEKAQFELKVQKYRQEREEVEKKRQSEQLARMEKTGEQPVDEQSSKNALLNDSSHFDDFLKSMENNVDALTDLLAVKGQNKTTAETILDGVLAQIATKDRQNHNTPINNVNKRSITEQLLLTSTVYLNTQQSADAHGKVGSNAAAEQAMTQLSHVQVLCFILETILKNCSPKSTVSLEHVLYQFITEGDNSFIIAESTNDHAPGHNINHNITQTKTIVPISPWISTTLNETASTRDNITALTAQLHTTLKNSGLLPEMSATSLATSNTPGSSANNAELLAAQRKQAANLAITQALSGIISTQTSDGTDNALSVTNRGNTRNIILEQIKHIQTLLHPIFVTLLDCWEQYLPLEWKSETKSAQDTHQKDIYAYTDMMGSLSKYLASSKDHNKAQITALHESLNDQHKKGKKKEVGKKDIIFTLTSPHILYHSYTILTTVAASFYYLGQIDVYFQAHQYNLQYNLNLKNSGSNAKNDQYRHNNHKNNYNNVNNVIDYAEISKQRLLRGELMILPFINIYLNNSKDVHNSTNTAIIYLFNHSLFSLFPYNTRLTHFNPILSQLNVWICQLISICIQCVPTHHSPDYLYYSLLYYQQIKYRTELDQVGYQYTTIKHKVQNHFGGGEIQQKLEEDREKQRQELRELAARGYSGHKSQLAKLDEIDKAYNQYERGYNRFIKSVAKKERRAERDLVRELEVQNNPENGQNDEKNTKLKNKKKLKAAMKYAQNVVQNPDQSETISIREHLQREFEEDDDGLKYTEDKYLLNDSDPFHQTNPLSVEYRRLYKLYHAKLKSYCTQIKNNLTKQFEKIYTKCTGMYESIRQLENELLLYIYTALQIYQNNEQRYVIAHAKRQEKYHNIELIMEDEDQKNTIESAITTGPSKRKRSPDIGVPAPVNIKKKDLQDDDFIAFDGDDFYNETMNNAEETAHPQHVEEVDGIIIQNDTDNDEQVALDDDLDIFNATDDDFENNELYSSQDKSGPIVNPQHFAIPPFYLFIDILWSIFPSLSLQYQQWLLHSYTSFYLALSTTPLSMNKVIALLPILGFCRVEYNGEQWLYNKTLYTWLQSFPQILSQAIPVSLHQQGSWLLSGNTGNKLLKYINWNFVIKCILYTTQYISLHYSAPNITILSQNANFVNFKADKELMTMLYHQQPVCTLYNGDNTPIDSQNNPELYQTILMAQQPYHEISVLLTQQQQIWSIMLSTLAPELQSQLAMIQFSLQQQKSPIQQEPPPLVELPQTMDIVPGTLLNSIIQQLTFNMTYSQQKVSVSFLFEILSILTSFIISSTYLNSDITNALALFILFHNYNIKNVIESNKNSTAQISFVSTPYQSQATSLSLKQRIYLQDLTLFNKSLCFNDKLVFLFNSSFAKQLSFNLNPYNKSSQALSVQYPATNGLKCVYYGNALLTSNMISHIIKFIQTVQPSNEYREALGPHVTALSAQSIIAEYIIKYFLKQCIAMINTVIRQHQQLKSATKQSILFYHSQSDLYNILYVNIAKIIQLFSTLFYFFQYSPNVAEFKVVLTEQYPKITLLYTWYLIYSHTYNNISVQKISSENATPLIPQSKQQKQLEAYELYIQQFNKHKQQQHASINGFLEFNNTQGRRGFNPLAKRVETTDPITQIITSSLERVSPFFVDHCQGLPYPPDLFSAAQSAIGFSSNFAPFPYEPLSGHFAVTMLSPLFSHLQLPSTISHSYANTLMTSQILQNRINNDNYNSYNILLDVLEHILAVIIALLPPKQRPHIPQEYALPGLNLIVESFRDNNATQFARYFELLFDIIYVQDIVNFFITLFNQIQISSIIPNILNIQYMYAQKQQNNTENIIIITHIERLFVQIFIYITFVKTTLALNNTEYHVTNMSYENLNKTLNSLFSLSQRFHLKHVDMLKQ